MPWHQVRVQSGNYVVDSRFHIRFERYGVLRKCLGYRLFVGVNLKKLRVGESEAKEQNVPFFRRGRRIAIGRVR